MREMSNVPLPIAQKILSRLAKLLLASPLYGSIMAIALLTNSVDLHVLMKTQMEEPCFSNSRLECRCAPFQSTTRVSVRRSIPFKILEKNKKALNNSNEDEILHLTIRGKYGTHQNLIARPSNSYIDPVGCQLESLSKFPDELVAPTHLKFIF